MGNDPTRKRTDLEIMAPWLKGQNISVYLTGRQAPMTRLTVCQVLPTLLIGRWNSSTHIIRLAHISAIRFGPDCDPTRNINHPLHTVVGPAKTNSNGEYTQVGDVLAAAREKAAKTPLQETL